MKLNEDVNKDINFVKIIVIFAIYFIFFFL